MGADVDAIVDWFLNRQLDDGGEEYLLARDLFRRRSTGQPFCSRVFSLAHPRRAYYHVLAAADYFRMAAAADGTRPDPRMAEAMENIRSPRLAA